MEEAVIIRESKEVGRFLTLVPLECRDHPAHAESLDTRTFEHSLELKEKRLQTQILDIPKIPATCLLEDRSVEWVRSPG